MSDKEKEQEKQPADIKVLYVGKDESYWNKLSARFDKGYDDKNCEFDIRIPDDEFSSLKTFVYIKECGFHIVYLDLSSDLQKFLELLKLLRKDQSTKQIACVVLHNLLVDNGTVSRVLFSGARANHIKSDEFSGVIFTGMALSTLDTFTKAPDYLSVAYTMPMTLVQDLRLSYVAKDYFSIETNSPLKVSDEIILESHPLSDSVKVKRFKVHQIKEEGLYYNTRYNIRLQYSIENMEAYKLPMQNWFNAHGNSLRPKKTKIFVIDPSLLFLKESEDELLKIDYSINVQTSVLNIDVPLKRFHPQMIVFVWQESNQEAEKNFINLFSKMKLLSNYSPFIFVLNSKFTAEKMRTHFKYDKLLTFPGMLEPHELRSLAQTCEQKINPTFNDETEARVYFSSDDTNAVVRFEREVELLGLSENLLYFRTDQILPDFTVFWITHPVEAMLTIVPNFPGEPPGVEKPYKTGLINYTGEKSNMTLRSHLNQLIQQKALDEKKALEGESEEKQEEVDDNQEASEAEESSANAENEADDKTKTK
ncbi:MAG: hypothetical protein ACPGJV_14660 [Bacteriovoracaceae bacterium]